MAVKKTEPAAPHTPRMVRIRVPRLPNQPDNKQVIYVGHNFRTYRIKRGVDVLVPEGVALRIEQAERAREEADITASRMAQN